MGKCTKGVTLIELILVIALLSLLFIPVMSNSIHLRRREIIELREFKNDINYARNRAIVESTSYGVAVRASTNTYTIYKYGLPTEIIKKKKFKDIKIKGINIDDEQVIFNYSGAPQSAGTIYLNNSKGRAIEITITPVTGKVNIEFY